MRLFVSFTCFLQLGVTAPTHNPANNDYDYLDFFALIHKLEELKAKEDSYKVANQLLHNKGVIIDVPTKLKKVGNGIDVDVEKTTTDGNSLERKKDKAVNYATYDDYYAYALPDYTYNYGNNDADDYADDYYFYPDDMPTTTAAPQTTTTQRINYTLPPVVNAPRPSKITAPKWMPESGKVSAPRPPASSNSQRVTFSDEYEYYDVFYYDDLGMKKKKKKKRKKKKGKNEPLNYGTGFQCWKCLSKNTYEDCRNEGAYETCNGGSIGCHIEVRSRRHSRTDPREIEKITMGCKQLDACVVEHKYNSVNANNFHPQCFEEDSTWHPLLQWNHSTCRQCCGDTNCNYQWLLPSYRLDTSAEWDTIDFYQKVPSY